jgi:hypothetical protein
MKMHLAVAVLLVALGTGCGAEGGGSQHPGLLVGAVDDAAKSGEAEAKVELARRAGFGALVFSVVWTPPLSAPPAGELDALRRAAEAADRAGIRPIVAVYQFSGATPLSDEDRARFAAYAAAIPRAIPQVRDVIVGNEPNLNLFWMPQFDPGGHDAAAPAYYRLLAQAYDALKAVDEDVNVIGGALAPRGQDDPAGARQTHSPTTFIEDLGAALRASGRARPVLDMFDLHPYGTNSSEPTIPHPRTRTIGLADYDKLVRLLRAALGKAPPVVYGEYGIETTVEAQAGAYTGTEPASIRPVSPEEQGRRYAAAIRRAACQPDVGCSSSSTSPTSRSSSVSSRASTTRTTCPRRAGTRSAARSTPSATAAREAEWTRVPEP